MAFQRDIEQNQIMLAHNITFQGADLASGGGSIVIVSRWYADGVAVTGDIVREINIAEKRAEGSEWVDTLDSALRALCEEEWAKIC